MHQNCELLKLYKYDKPIIKSLRAIIIVTQERSNGTLLVSGKIARAFLGTCESAVRDLVQHGSMLFSKIVSLIRVFLLCRPEKRQYYIVVGFAIHEHITACSTSYMCTNITVLVKKRYMPPKI